MCLNSPIRFLSDQGCSTLPDSAQGDFSNVAESAIFSHSWPVSPEQKKMTIPRLLTAALLLFCIAPLSTYGQDDAKDKATETKAADTKPEEAKDPQKEWKSLTDRRLEIAKRMKELRVLFEGSSSIDEKTRYRDEFNSLNDEFGTRVLPRLRALRDTILKTNPDEPFANEMLMYEAFESNQYPKAASHAEKVIAAGDPNARVLSIAGVSSFAQHKFEEALKHLKSAGNQDQMVRQYLKAAEEYVGLWKEEQAIRKAEESSNLPRVEFDTSRGKIEMVLYEDQAPNTVANFIELIESKTYDGTKFHRVINNFMIQGGDPLSKDDNPANDGTGGPGHTIKCECHTDAARMHFAGTLSMAHAGRDSGGSQFFITHLPTAHLNKAHTAFGRVVKGMDVVNSVKKGDTLKTARVLSKRDHEYKAEKTESKK